MILTVITILFLFLYAVVILYYRWGWLKIPEYIPSGIIPTTRITVIIPARNEERNIGNLLNGIISQTYPAHLFEAIVVDDFSTDKTAAIVQGCRQSNIRLLSLADFVKPGSLNSYKKKGIESAIGVSTGTLIITTDADCLVNKEWLQTIAACYEEYKPALIAAPVAYHGELNYLDIFQSLDFMTLQGITGASVNSRFHNMCNGANLAYEKSAFYEAGGFIGIDNIASGDDMLLMDKISRLYPGRIRFLKSGKAIVQTKPADSLGAFFNQRIRWASKSDQYGDNKILGILLLVYFFNLLLLVMILTAVFYPVLWMWLIGIVLAKTMIEMLFLYPVAAFFQKTGLLLWFPISEPFHILYTVIAGWLGKFGSYQWKGRKVK